MKLLVLIYLTCKKTKLFNKIKLIGVKSGWKTIRWITRDNNYQARRVYDQIGHKTDWNLYEVECE